MKKRLAVKDKHGNTVVIYTFDESMGDRDDWLKSAVSELNYTCPDDGPFKIEPVIEGEEIHLRGFSNVIHLEIKEVRELLNEMEAFVRKMSCALQLIAEQIDASVCSECKVKLEKAGALDSIRTIADITGLKIEGVKRPG